MPRRPPATPAARPWYPTHAAAGHPDYCTCPAHPLPGARAFPRSRNPSARGESQGGVRAQPFGPDLDPGRANLPPSAISADQPPAPPMPTKLRAGYHDRTLRAYNPSHLIGGWTKERKDRAIELHDQGIFLESSALVYAARRYAPVATAMMLRRAPVLFLDRKLRRGSRGLARVVGQEIESQLADRGHGELPSPTFPSQLWGSIEDDLAMMGWCWLQHVVGPPDAQGVRTIWTRRWPTWATQYYRYRRTFVAVTMDGPVDMIDGDGKWTLIAKSDEPIYDGAIRAVGSEYLSGGFARMSLDNYIDMYGDPKWVGFGPEGVGPGTPEGLQFSDSLIEIKQPGGWGEFPFGSKIDVVQLDAKTSAVFNDGDRLSLRNILIAILGSEGGIEKNTGVYTPESIMGVRYDIAADDLAAITRGLNFGLVGRHVDMNYAASVEVEKAAGRWVDPVLEIELPDAEQDARTAAIGKRMLLRAEIFKANADSGIANDQDEADKVSGALELEPVPMIVKRVGGEIFEYHITNKQVSPDEVRDDLGLPPLADGIGSTARLAEERAGGKDRTGAKVAQQVSPEGTDVPAPDAEPTPEEPEPAPEQQGSAPVAPPAKGPPVPAKPRAAKDDRVEVVSIGRGARPPLTLRSGPPR